MKCCFSCKNDTYSDVKTSCVPSQIYIYQNDIHLYNDDAILYLKDTVVYKYIVIGVKL